jgi:hypothetical protein
MPMKRLSTIVCILLVLSSITAASQPCPPYNLTFTTQSSIDNFQAVFPDCTEIEFSVKVEGSDITNLNGLSNITSIGGDLRILHTERLVDLTGLENLSFIGHMLEIHNNDSLSSIYALNSLSAIGGFVKIIDNPQLVSLAGLEGVSTEWLDIVNNDNLTNLTGLSSMDEVGWLTISGNDELLSLEGLEQLSDVHYLTIEYNQSLQSLVGLNKLSEVRSLHLHSNSNLSDLEGLDNLPLIESLIIEENDILLTLSGLDSVQVLIDLVLVNNPQLSVCNVQSICAYLSNPPGYLDISNNSDGCNNAQEVEDDCLSSISEQPLISITSLFPNPFTTSTTIEYELYTICNMQYTVYNMMGEVVFYSQENMLPPGRHKITWSPGHLPAGIYYGVLRSGDGMTVVKLIKQ